MDLMVLPDEAVDAYLPSNMRPCKLVSSAVLRFVELDRRTRRSPMMSNSGASPLTAASTISSLCYKCGMSDQRECSALRHWLAEDLHWTFELIATLAPEFSLARQQTA
ncbi:hypothetical protein KC330_g7 [Hortaea werneckii]|nr:hypothetical protein KC330_g7 [Hortaea werneckii]